MRPCWRNHVWAYDFVQARTHDGKAFGTHKIIDEHTRECLAIQTARRLRHDDILARRPTCSPSMDRRTISDPTTAVSSPPPRSESGCQSSTCRRCISSPVHRGRTARVNRSTGSFATSCSMARSFTRRGKARCTSNDGAFTTIRSGRTVRSATGRRHHKQSLPHRADQRSEYETPQADRRSPEVKHGLKF